MTKFIDNIWRAVARRKVLIGTFSLAASALVASSMPASALPSFARQTGQPCAACHTAFPELTPFGRRFKLNGYTLFGADKTSSMPHVAMMLMPTFTHTGVAQDAPPAPHTKTNDNLILQQASLFYGGQIFGKLGAFIQATYDRATGRTLLDNTDVRYADNTKLFGQDLLYGFDFNNSPTVQDVWTTTPAWGFPEAAPTLAPQFAPPGTLIEGALSGKVASAGFYTFWNDMAYFEISGYQMLSKGQERALGEPDSAISDGLKGVAPYWRIAFEPDWGPNSWEIGTFGIDAHIHPMRVSTFGSDHYTDIGFDTQYQYNGDKNSFTVRASDIFEHQHLASTFNQGGSTNLNNTLRSFKFVGSWVYDHTYSLSAEYFDVAGSSDKNLYGGNSVVKSPNGRGMIFDAAYLPFSHGGPKFWPWANARIGISYTHFLQVYGGTTNFDGAGHDAKGNDVTFLYSWIAF